MPVCEREQPVYRERRALPCRGAFPQAGREGVAAGPGAQVSGVGQGVAGVLRCVPRFADCLYRFVDCAYQHESLFAGGGGYV